MRGLLTSWELRQIRRRLVDSRLLTKAAFETAQRDLEASGLLDHIVSERERFYAQVSGNTPRGNPYGFGAMALGEAINLYALVRQHTPERVVETGVCNGVSTAVILQALEDNGQGHLWSIDLPEIADDNRTGLFWEGKGGAVIPAGKQPGWIIPEHLRHRWTLLVGKSQDLLPGLLDDLGTIDLFLHDSEHSYECMWFEFEAAFPHLTDGGLLVSDDIGWNSAFDEFIEASALKSAPLGPGMAVAHA